jgi:hypothetical protein
MEEIPENGTKSSNTYFVFAIKNKLWLFFVVTMQYYFITKNKML